jgi:hypothetical protein
MRVTAKKQISKNYQKNKKSLTIFFLNKAKALPIPLIKKKIESL